MGRRRGRGTSRRNSTRGRATSVKKDQESKCSDDVTDTENGPMEVSNCEDSSDCFKKLDYAVCINAKVYLENIDSKLGRIRSKGSDSDGCNKNETVFSERDTSSFQDGKLSETNNENEVKTVESNSITMEQDDTWDDPCLSGEIMYEEVIEDDAVDQNESQMESDGSANLNENVIGTTVEEVLVETNDSSVGETQVSQSSINCSQKAAPDECGDHRSVVDEVNSVSSTTTELASDAITSLRIEDEDVSTSSLNEAESLSLSETDVKNQKPTKEKCKPESNGNKLRTFNFEKMVTRSRSKGKNDVVAATTKSVDKPSKKQVKKASSCDSDNEKKTNCMAKGKTISRPEASQNCGIKRGSVVKGRKVTAGMKSAVSSTSTELNISIDSEPPSIPTIDDKHLQLSHSTLEGSVRVPRIDLVKIELESPSSSQKPKNFSPKEIFKQNYIAESKPECDEPSLLKVDKAEKEVLQDEKKQSASFVNLFNNDKIKPMSPKEMLKKLYSSEVSLEKVSDVTMCSVKSEILMESIVDKSDDSMLDKVKKESPDFDCKSKPISPKGFIKKNYSAGMNWDDIKEEKSDEKGCSFENDKPVKVKSRWRRTSELEMGTGRREETGSPTVETRTLTGEVSLMEEDCVELSVISTRSSPEPAPTPLYTITDAIDPVVEARLKAFTSIDTNEYVTERCISKEAKKMLCDCTITKEEILRGEKGCGEDCLNRLLFIECGLKCSLGSLCSNKRFVNREYAKCIAVDTKNKGIGVVSAENLDCDQFIMEYVGEVIDSKEFRKRAKEYSKEKSAHFYFMSFKADTVIDATQKGNISRFINHSCDPNAMTQKWTVNGELRIGFFSKRPIPRGEEITFDYRLQRYGKEAQKCYCGSSNCRGWLGGDPDKENEVEQKDTGKDETSRKEKKEKKKKEDKRKDSTEVFNDSDLEEEIEKLSGTGLKNRQQTLALSRLMVRAGEEEARLTLLGLIISAATPCLRLFLDYNGLGLLAGWSTDPRASPTLKLKIMETLAILPIQNKTILKDSKILSIIEKWAQVEPADPVPKDSSVEEENSSSPQEVGKESLTQDEESEGSKEEEKEGEEKQNEKDKKRQGEEVVVKAKRLVEAWAELKEEFRIPKKERVEQMKEHEREADLSYVDPRENLSYNRRRFRERRESRFDRVRYDKDKRKEDDWAWKVGPDDDPRMSKAERRQLFALKVQKEERERRESEEMWWRHQNQCKILGVNPRDTAMYHPDLNALVYYHSQTYTWQSHPERISEERVNFLLDCREGLPVGGGGPICYPGEGYPVRPGHQRPPLLPTPSPVCNRLGPGIQCGPLPGVQPPHHQPPPHLIPQSPHHNPHLQPPFLPRGHHGLPPSPHLSLPPSQPLHGVPQSPVSGHLGVPPSPVHPGHLGVPPSPVHPGHLGVPPSPVHPGHLGLPPGHLGVPGGHLVQSPLPPGHLGGPPSQVAGVHLGVPLAPGHLGPAALDRPPLQLYPSPMLNPTAPSPHFPHQFPTNSPAASFGSVPPPPPPSYPPPLKLPPKWKAVRDKLGRTYYYHIKTRKTQWVFPNPAPPSDSSSAEEESESSDEDDDEDEEEEDDSSVDFDNDKMDEDEDFGMDDLMKKRKSKLEVDEEPPMKKSKDVLVKVNIFERAEMEHVKGISKSKIRDNKEQVKREKLREKKRHRQWLKLTQKETEEGPDKKAKLCEADTSTGNREKKRIMEMFRIKMADVVVSFLNQYMKPDCEVGRITSTADFKALARKLTYFIMMKELKHCERVADLKCNDNVKHKARDFIRKYMSKFGPVYKKKEDTLETNQEGAHEDC